jgi:hypothetical protein
MQTVQLINAINAWLQRFGHRDNECFYYDIENWHLMLQYHYDLDGEIYEPFSWAHKGTKLGSRGLDTYDESTLKEILSILLKVKKHY